MEVRATEQRAVELRQSALQRRARSAGSCLIHGPGRDGKPNTNSDCRITDRGRTQLPLVRDLLRVAASTSVQRRSDPFRISRLTCIFSSQAFSGSHRGSLQLLTDLQTSGELRSVADDPVTLYSHR
jgi:hypothetical protein